MRSESRYKMWTEDTGEIVSVEFEPRIILDELTNYQGDDQDYKTDPLYVNLDPALKRIVDRMMPYRDTVILSGGRRAGVTYCTQIALELLRRRGKSYFMGQYPKGDAK